ncbi:MAG: hypothetical protein KJ696_00900 [Gammaproteobacteria bacterium]|nr:hypothetical protein [Gammaproteobacteria bacterium]
MDKNTIFTKTAKGLREASGKTSLLTRDMRNILKEIDGRCAIRDLLKKFDAVSPADMKEALTILVGEDFIREVERESSVAPVSAARPSTPAVLPASGGDLDFTSLPPPASRPDPAVVEAATRAAEAIRAQQEAEARAKAEAVALAQKQAQEKSAREAEALAKAKAKADALANKVEEERLRHEAEERAREKSKAEAQAQAEAHARKLAEKRAQREAEEKARQEAEARARVEAEAKAKREAEETAQREAEEKAGREAEEQARREAEEKARQEAEARAKAEAEAKAKREAEEAAQREAEEKARREAEEQTRREAEEKVRQEAEARAKAEAEAKAKREAEETAQREAEEQARREAEEKVRQEAEARAKAEAEAKAKREAEETAQREAEEQAAQREADEKARREAEEQARREAEEKARQEAESRTKAEAEAKAKRESEEAARREAEEQERRAAEERAEQAAEAYAIERAEQLSRYQAQEDSRPVAVAGGARSKGDVRDTPAESGKSFAWGRLLVAAAVALPVLGLALMQFVSFDGKITQLEAAASTQLQQPVRIASVHVSLLPQPRWLLGGVVVGANGQIKAPRISVAAGLGSLFGGEMAFESMEVDAPVFNEEGFGWLLFGTAKGQIEMRNAKLDSRLVDLPAFAIKGVAAGDGTWRSLTMEAADKTLVVDLKSQGAAVRFEANAGSFAVPFGAGLNLSDFSAAGLATREGITLTEFKSRLHGGVLSGTAKLRWGRQWSLDGNLEARQIDTALAFPKLLEGDKLEGKASYAARADDAARLFDTVRVEGAFAMKKGTLLGVDLVRMLQRGEAGGKTDFSEVTGSFAHERGLTLLRQIRLSAGILSASGNAEVDSGKNINGRLSVDMRMANEQRRASVAISGTTKAVTWSSR